MVFYHRKPYWALSTHSGTVPGSEFLESECSSWDSPGSLNWIGVSGFPSSGCSWNGGTTSNYRGADATAFTSYGPLNSYADMVTASDSSVVITTGQGLRINEFRVYLNVGWDHLPSTPRDGWNFQLVVDGIAVPDTTCTLGPRPGGSGARPQTCQVNMNYYVDIGSTLSIASNWNATKSSPRYDQIIDIDWRVIYDLGDP